MEDEVLIGWILAIIGIIFLVIIFSSLWQTTKDYSRWKDMMYASVTLVMGTLFFAGFIRDWPTKILIPITIIAYVLILPAGYTGLFQPMLNSFSFLKSNLQTDTNKNDVLAVWVSILANLFMMGVTIFLVWDRKNWVVINGEQVHREVLKK